LNETHVLSPTEQENVLARLKAAQDGRNYVTEEKIAEIADSLGLPVGEVYGVATFYSFLSVKKVGRNVIRVCQSLPCHLKGAETVAKTITETLDIAPGETTPDGRFTLEMTNCIGACDLAPAMLVNGDLHGNLTPEKIVKILKGYK